MYSSQLVLPLLGIQIKTTVAIPIRSIPTLRGKVAEAFMKKADKAAKERAAIDMSKQAKMFSSILSKAKI